MMKRSPLFAGLPLVAIILAVTLPSQTNTNPPPSGAAEMIAGMQFLTPITAGGAEKTELWSLGNRFNASFHDGFRFYSKDHEHRRVRSLAWKTVAITVAGKPVTKTFRRKTQHQEYRCTYVHGAGVTERYDLSKAGVEQSFLLTQRPTGAGDLCIVGRVTTTLQAETVSDQHTDLLFVDSDGNPTTSYGKAFAFDADGKQHNIRTSWDGECITLRVDGNWLRTARFPLLIDPLVGSRTILNRPLGGKIHYRSLSIGRESLSKQHNTMLAYSADYRDTQGILRAELYVVLCNQNFTDPRVVFASPQSSTGSASILSEANSLAPVHGARRWVVAFGAHTQVYLHDFGNTTFSSGTTLDLPRPQLRGVTGHARFGVVGGTRHFEDKGPIKRLKGTRALIAAKADVFFRIGSGESFPAAILVDAKSRTLVGNWIRLSSLKACHDVRINQTNDGTSKSPWMVLWSPIISPDNVHGTLVDPAGNAKQPASFAPLNDQHLFTSQPRIAGGHGQYMIAFHHQEDFSQSFQLVGKKLMAVQRFDWADNAAAPSVQPLRILAGNTPHIQRLVFGIAYDAESRSHWAVTGATHHQLFGISTGFVMRLHANGTIHEERTLWSSNHHDAFALTAAITFDPATQCFPIAYSQPPRTQFGRWNLQGTNLCYHYVLTPTPFGPGHGLISANSKSVPGNRNFSVQLQRAPANQPATLIMGTQRISQSLSRAGMPGSYLLVGNVRKTYRAMTNARGEASVRVALPNTARQTLYFQWIFDTPQIRTATKQATSPGLRVLMR